MQQYAAVQDGCPESCDALTWTDTGAAETEDVVSYTQIHIKIINKATMPPLKGI